MRLWLAMLLMILLSACGTSDPTTQALPTLITDLDAVATEQTLTQNAPPTPYHLSIRVPSFAEGLDELPSWRADLSVEFTGTFAGTSRATEARTEAHFFYRLLGDQRRVALTVSGEILGQPEPLTTEGVRLGPEVFFVRDNSCSTVPQTAAIADLSVGDLIGGVREAVPDGTKGVINGQTVWRYGFLPEDLNLVNITLAEGGRINFANGELWFAPTPGAVIRFYLTMDVENAVLFGGDTPVTGIIVIRYDLLDIGVDPNINIPFGC
ncbi:MAG: hypothetical protein MUF87_04735 [Anaerolineae bacterium]|jgi:hypothetical protein|nr:hypothetical protein [Anaerolineae bacterium]